MECQCCGSTSVTECDYEEKYDGLGNCIVIHYYVCEDCGCEFEEVEEITRGIKLTKINSTWDMGECKT